MPDNALTGNDNYSSATSLPIYATMASNVLIANLPQLIVSMLYLLYNDLFTRIQISREWTSYYQKHLPLRVSSPSGVQRSTPYLQLPLWWTVPLLTLMTALHWMISQSIFYALVETRIDPGDVTTDQTSYFSVNGVGWSPLGLMISAIIGAALIVLLWLASCCIRLPNGMPVVRSCSAAISAACHGPSWDIGASQKLLAWGVVGSGVREDTEHAAFSSGETQPLREGVVYT